MKAKGIHHISTIVWHAQENIDFYAGLLGLRLIKKTVNFDDPYVYHTYFGNNEAEIGTVITFFPWKKDYKEGMTGDGQVGITSYAIPNGSAAFWKTRLNRFKVPFDEMSRFGEHIISFTDPHGIVNELIESDLGHDNAYAFNGIGLNEAIKGFYGAVLYSGDIQGTSAFLEKHLGLTKILENDLYIRFEAESVIGKYIDLFKHSMGASKMGAGTVHHIAFAVESDELEPYRNYFIEQGFYPTEVKPRKYFNSIYLREPGGIIVELATTAPGFTVDEDLETLGTRFNLPPQYESIREQLEQELMPISVREIDQLESYPYQDRKSYEKWEQHRALLDQINYYARLAKTRTLTTKEIAVRDGLRKQYIKNITHTVKRNLENVSYQDAEGSITKLEKKDK